MIHPQLFYYAGGELLCLHVCKALQGIGYKVTLASDTFNPSEAERIYGLGKVLESCDHKQIPQFSPILPRFLEPQRLAYAKNIRTLFSRTDADLVFSTQSSPFYIPGKRMFHFVYSIRDLFSYPPHSTPPKPPAGGTPIRRPYYFMISQFRKLFWEKYSPSPAWFFAVGSRVLQDLQGMGYRNSSLIFPPCRTIFKPRLPKRKQVIQVTRMIPDKRLEVFVEIAKMLPQYSFYIVGRDPPELQRLNPGYSKGLLSKLPSNIEYVEALARARPELLEESKVYLYTGAEQGIGIALVEAIAAGCIPFSPPEVGAADIIRASKVGGLYNTAQEAAMKIKKVLETDYTSDEIYDISKRAQLFSPEIFEERVRMMAANY